QVSGFKFQEPVWRDELDGDDVLWVGDSSDLEGDRSVADRITTRGQPSSGRRAEATSVQRVDGVGWVFDPDPLTTAGVEYGGEFVDNFDADSEGLTSQLFEVTL